jgi:hypothetical protein
MALVPRADGGVIVPPPQQQHYYGGEDAPVHSGRHKKSQQQAAGPTFIVQARADASPGPQVADGRRKAKSDGDWIADCAWEKCEKPKIAKDVRAISDGLVLVCSADCGGRAIHDSCAVALVAHYGTEHVSERLPCERCDGCISLRHYVWNWDSWGTKLGAAADLLRAAGRYLFWHGLVLLIAISLAHRVVVFGAAYGGWKAPDRANNPQLGAAQELALFDFFSYRFVWHQVNSAQVLGAESKIVSSLDRWACKLEGKCSRDEQHAHMPKPDCVAHWYPGFLLSPRQNFCELEHMAAAWFVLAILSFAGRVVWRAVRHRRVLQLLWIVLVVFTFGFAYWVSTKWTHARRKRLNAMRNRPRKTK